ncbi:hypothetical protein GCM10023336_51400 [Streptomyces similanensis]|uniref:Translation initiation factor IF-2 n=1 Tax=Streptomyces similanensis TaxID=1274988 RepID=A0ABP9L323_9ACTN
MSHEQMLAWLDQASSGEVQAAAGRLATAATEIQRIAEQLKLRPQVVEWKGEGADAFRSWANELANSSLRLADFSKAAGVQLGHASDAIATAQASIPRDTKGAQANLDAATAAHNDPDSAAIRAKSASELAALKADREKVRQEAADQMRKLAQSYQASTTQMNGLERPQFPPPPAAIAPPAPVEASEDLARPGGSASQGTGGGSSGSGPAGVTGSKRVEHKDVVASGPHVHADAPVKVGSTPPHSSPPTIRPDTHVGVEPDAHVNVDTVSTPPGVHQRSTGSAGGPPMTTRPETGPLLPMTGPVPPMPQRSARLPSAPGGSEAPIGRGRVPSQPGEGPLGRSLSRGVTGGSAVPAKSLPASDGPMGRAVPGGQGPVAGRQGPVSGRGSTSNSGITGGRPSTPPGTGKSMGRGPSASFGGEHTTGRGAAGRASNAGATGQPATRGTGPGAGRSAATPRAGIVGGTPQQTGRAPARPGAPVPSAPTRGGISGGVPSETRTRGGRGASSGSSGGARQRKDKQRKDRRDEPPANE